MWGYALMAKHPGGRPTVMTAEVIRKLEEAFSWGCTDREAYFYAGVSSTAFYDYCQENPGFAERKELLKENPIRKARATIIANLDDPKNAQWYLERKKKDEFSAKTETEVSGGVDPVRILLDAYGLTEGDGDGREADESVQGSLESSS